MPELEGQEAGIKMTVEIIRKATGEKETYELVGKVDNNETEQLEDLENGRNS